MLDIIVSLSNEEQIDIMELFVLSLLYLVATTLTLAAFEASTKTEREVLTFLRAKKMADLISKRSCKDLTAGQNCTLIKQREPSQMHFYMAEKLKEESSLNMLVPTRPSPFDLFKHLDGVVVVDPMPDAHFGHAIMVALLKLGLTKDACDKVKGTHYMSPG